MRRELDSHHRSGTSYSGGTGAGMGSVWQAGNKLMGKRLNAESPASGGPPLGEEGGRQRGKPGRLSKSLRKQDWKRDQARILMTS